MRDVRIAQAAATTACCMAASAWAQRRWTRRFRSWHRHVRCIRLAVTTAWRSPKPAAPAPTTAAMARVPSKKSAVTQHTTRSWSGEAPAAAAPSPPQHQWASCWAQAATATATATVSACTLHCTGGVGRPASSAASIKGLLDNSEPVLGLLLARACREDWSGSPSPSVLPGPRVLPGPHLLAAAAAAATRGATNFIASSSLVWGIGPGTVGPMSGRGCSGYCSCLDNRPATRCTEGRERSAGRGKTPEELLPPKVPPCGCNAPAAVAVACLNAALLDTAVRSPASGQRGGSVKSVRSCFSEWL